MIAAVVAAASIGSFHFENGCDSNCDVITNDPITDSNFAARWRNALEYCNPTQSGDYCDIDTWDVSRVTNLDKFGDPEDGTWNNIGTTMADFNEPISSWDVSEVTSMKNLFSLMGDYNQAIGGWNVAQVTDLSGAFKNMVHFNHGIDAWNVAEVTDLSSTFEASAFNRDLGSWNTQKVTSLASTFKNTRAFQDDSISNWNTAKVTDMSDTFHGLSKFQTSSIYDVDLSNWNTGQVTTMKGIFKASRYHQFTNLNGWDVSKVTTLESFMEDRLDGLYSNVSAWDVSAVTNMNSFGPDDATYDAEGDPLYTMDITAWSPASGVSTTNFGSCKTFDPPPYHIHSACTTTSTTETSVTTSTTVTTTTITTTTVADCGAGKRLITGNICEDCAPGKYRIFSASAGHPHEALTECRPHSSCGPGEITLFGGSSVVDTQCAVPSATSHCGSDEFVDGVASQYKGTWHLQCVAHSSGETLNETQCPWANSGHANSGDTATGIEIEDGDNHDNTVMSAANETFFQNIDELIRAENNKGHVWVRLCTPKRTCLEDLNEYVVHHGSDTSNRECSVCPRVCGGVEYVQPDGCPQTAIPTDPLPRTECTVPNGNNSEICCRIDYDRDVFQQDLQDGDCTHDPFGNTNASNHGLSHQCTGIVASRPIISTTTTSASSTTGTETSFTTSTTHLTMCNPGEFRNSATNLCENCPDGQFQPSVNFVGTSCRPHSTCDNETEIELTAVDVIDARKHDTLCGTLQECPNGQYRVNHDDGTVQSGSWKIDCRTLEALSGADACDQHPGSDLNITIFQNETTGGLIVQHDVEALRNVPLIHVCSFWTDCLASENQYIASDASTSSDRVCQQCPYLESNTEVQSDWTQHSCNMREADDGSYSTSAGYHGECMGVTRDNAHYCCRRGFDRKLFHFREATAEDCRIHALNEDDVGISYAWLANSILVPNPTTTTITTVTESKLTSTSTTPPETIDVSGDTVKIVAAGTSSTEEEAAGFAALGIGVAVIIGVCAVGIYQARKSSFSDRKLFHEEKRKILFHVE